MVQEVGKYDSGCRFVQEAGHNPVGAAHGCPLHEPFGRFVRRIYGLTGSCLNFILTIFPRRSHKPFDARVFGCYVRIDTIVFFSAYSFVHVISTFRPGTFHCSVSVFHTHLCIEPSVTVQEANCTDMIVWHGSDVVY